MNFGFSSLIGRGKRLSLWRSLLDVQENETPEDEDEMMLEDSMLNDGIAVQRSLFEEEFHRPMVQGVLAVKIRSAVLSQEVLSEFRCLYCTIMLRNFIVRTSVVSTNTPKIVWDQIKHFPARVVRNRMHPFNHVKVQLLGFDSHGREREVGAVAFHLHEIIKASPISGMYDVWGKHFEVGQMELELTFSYGMFGYGSSVQLQDEDILPEEAIQYSLMPRINPAQDLCEPEEPVLAVQAVPHPGFIPFRNKVHLSYGKDIQNELEEISRTMYRPEILMQDFEAMEHVRHKYYSISSRAVRLMYLHTFLQESSNRPETVTEEHEPIRPQGFPRMTYMRFVSPASSLEEPAPVENYLGADPQKHDEAIPKPENAAQNKPKVMRTREMMGDFEWEVMNVPAGGDRPRISRTQGPESPSPSTKQKLPKEEALERISQPTTLLGRIGRFLGFS